MKLNDVLKDKEVFFNMIGGKWLGLALLLLSLSMIAVQEQPEATKKQSIIESLLSNDPNKVEQAQKEILVARADLVSSITTFLNDEQNLRWKRNSAESAIFILGEIRAVEAIPILVDRIAYVVDPFPGTSRGILDLPPRQRWPAVDALIKIGEPCIPELIKKLSTTDHISEQQACLTVLLQFRDRDTVGTMLKDAIAKETDARNRLRLQHSLEDILPLVGEKQQKPQ